MATPAPDHTVEPTRVGSRTRTSTIAGDESTARSGRIARTKGVSLLPGEYNDLATVEELTGVGFSEVYRRYFAAQIRAAADLLRNAHDAGIALDRNTLRDTWDIHMTPDELASIYTAESELSSGE